MKYFQYYQSYKAVKYYTVGQSKWTCVPTYIHYSWIRIDETRLFDFYWMFLSSFACIAFEKNIGGNARTFWLPNSVIQPNKSMLNISHLILNFGKTFKSFLLRDKIFFKWTSYIFYTFVNKLNIMELTCFKYSINNPFVSFYAYIVIHSYNIEILKQNILLLCVYVLLLKRNMLVKRINTNKWQNIEFSFLMKSKWKFKKKNWKVYLFLRFKVWF